MYVPAHAATHTDADVYVPAHAAADPEADLHVSHAETTAVEPAAASAEPEPAADADDSLDLTARTPGVGQR